MALLAIHASASFAQVGIGSLPGAVQRRSQETLDLLQRERQLERDQQEHRDASPVEAPARKASVPTADADLRVHIKTIVVSASEVLAPSAVTAIIRDFENRELSMADLNTLKDRLNSLYVEQGFVTARAIIPPQRLSDGVLQIRLVEAHLDKIVVTNNEFTRDTFILDRVPQNSGDLVNVPELEEQLIRFNALNDVKIRAALQPGSQPETTDILLSAFEPKKITVNLYADNLGRDSIGEERLGFFVNNNSLSGRRDKLTIGGNAAEGSKQGFATYSAPVSTSGSRVTVGYDYSEVDIISGELSELDISGDSEVASMSFTTPLSVSRETVYSGTLAYNHKESTTDFADVESLELSTRTLVLGTEQRHFGQKLSSWANVALVYGTEQFGGDTEFAFLTLDFLGSISAFETGQFHTRVRAQISDGDILPSSEQFQLGGSISVRGYPEGYLLGEEGYLTSLEYRIPVTGSAGSVGNGLSANVFLDHGGIFSNIESERFERREFLTAVGLGLSYRFWDKFWINLQLGLPVFDETDYSDDYRFHVIASFLPF